MRYLVLGASGFIGSHLCAFLRRQNAEVVGADIRNNGDRRIRFVDLNIPESIDELLSRVCPDIIIQAAGLVEQSERAVSWNPLFTHNLLEAVIRNGMSGIHKIIIIGSAAEYGDVSAEREVVNEDTPLRAVDDYGRSKVLETSCALSFREQYGLPIIVVRLFNILGLGGVESSRPGRLIPNTLKQFGEVKMGLRSTIDHLNRFDTARDYIDIEDVANVIALLAQSGENQWSVYNLGSGVKTTNRDLIDRMRTLVGLPDSIDMIEQSDIPEPRRADCADISRLTQEFVWKPKKTIDDSLALICKHVHNASSIPLLIVGAGVAGQLVARDIIRHIETSFRVLGFVDDDPKKRGTLFNGIPILGSIDDTPSVIKQNAIAEVLIAVPSERGDTVRRTVEQCEGTGVKFKILPRIAEVVAQEYHNDYYRYIRELRIEDIFGGGITTAQTHVIKAYTNKKVIMITGAAGSIGSELSKQLAASNANTLVFYDWWENGMFELRNYMRAMHPEMKCHFIIGDIRDQSRFASVLAQYRPHTIFHAAAYKHVGLMQDNPSEAIKNNIVGTKLIAHEAIKAKIDRMVFISSDKAVDPKSIMGVTKRIAEKMLMIFGSQEDHTHFSLVRFGNVMHSYGSVIPLFVKQIDSGGPVTVTDPRVTRYFMTIPEAVHLVLQAWTLGKGNDLFMLNMGDPIKIEDLARLLIILRGYTVDTIGIRYTGLSPGEKLEEKLFTDDEVVHPTDHERIWRIEYSRTYDQELFSSTLQDLVEIVHEGKEDYTIITPLLNTLLSA